MIESDDRAALLALLNFVLNSVVAWACLCRISLMSLSNTKLSTRAGYSLALTLAVGSATMPLWGRDFYPGLGSVFASSGLLALLWASRHAWDKGRPPPHALAGDDDAMRVVPAPRSAWVAAGIVPAVIVLLMLFPPMEAALRGGILRDFEPTRVWAEGDDLFVEGKVRKWWGCEWIPPHRAYAAGKPLRFASLSPDSHKNRPPLRELMDVGPWIIHGGAGQVVEVYSEHRCSFWSIVTHVATIDARGVR